MQELENILSHYQEDDRIIELSDHLQLVDRGRILLQGVAGSSYAFMIAALRHRLQSPILVIEDNKEQAAYLQNTLQNILPDVNTHLLPDSFKRPGRYNAFDNHNIQLRTEVLSHLVEGSKPESLLIISYPEALVECFPDTREVLQDKITIKIGENLNLDSVLEFLIDMGFERTDFVYEPGQFSIRGGLIDVFSHGNEWPYRIELFDEEVESIREFDPLTQLSRRQMAILSILPNVQSASANIPSVSLMDQIHDQTILYLRSPEVLYARLEECHQAFAKKLDHLRIHEEDPEIEQKFQEFRLATAQRTQEMLDAHSFVSHDPSTPATWTHKLDFKIRPQTSFNKNMKLLIDELQSHEKSGIRNFLFSENARQIERFHSIFEDLRVKVQLEPLPIAIHEGFVDNQGKIACYTDHQIFNRFHKYRLRKGYTRNQALQVKMLRSLQPGDYVTHIDHGVGKYSGLEKITVNGKVQESLRLLYRNNDVLYVGINSLHKISKYAGKESSPPALNKIGGDQWKKIKARTKKKVKDIAKELIQLYAKRKASQGFAFGPDGYLQNELEASFMYDDTPDQYSTTLEVKEDMMKESPMDRLICGDVGFGKTEIAIRATFKAVVHGKQVAVLVPTTILALQHHKTFKKRLETFGVSVDYLNRFRSTKEKKEIYQKVQEGKIDVLIGTHALLNKQVKFKDLGLLVIDEEQKFGVAAKEKLKKLKVNVDTLTLTATPIPRTLQFSLMSARDLSVMRTAPPNRQPIHTERRVFNDDLIRDSIMYEYMRGGQVFFVHNRVQSLPDMAALVRRICPEVSLAMAHGQMDVKILEKTLVDFIEGGTDVLVSTNIIETGLDISNANTIIINNAHQYGLSDLHQLRGRVGRSNRKAYCYLFTPPISVLTPEARKRIQTIEDFSDLGSGFQIAMKDLDIRGAGNILGGEQSGFISDIGFETYQKILDEAINELKTGEFENLFGQTLEVSDFVKDTDVEIDDEMMIPDEYVNVIQERLDLYTQLNELKDEEELSVFRRDLEDRFGPVPDQVQKLFQMLRLRWKAKDIGFVKLLFKNNNLRGSFPRDPKSPFFETKHFQKIMQRVAEDPSSGWKLKQTPRNLALYCTDIGSVNIALARLDLLLDREPSS